MRWEAALEALLARVGSDPRILEILGGAHVHHEADIREYRVPSVVYSVIHFGEDEVFEPLLVQWGAIAPTSQIAALRNRLRRLVTAPTERTVGGVWMTMEFQDGSGRVHRPPAIGVQHHSFDARYQPLRQRYFDRA
jgi:hypothetical protein